MAEGAGLAGRRLLLILVVVVIVVVIIIIVIVVVVIVLVVIIIVVLVVIFIRSGGRRRRGLRLSAITGALAAGATGRLLDGDTAVLTVPRATGDDVRILSKRHVDDATIRGRHGVKGDGPPSPSHVIRRALGNLLQSIDVALLIPLHVDAERDIVADCA